MKRLDITAQVPENIVDELNAEIKELIENKFGGKVKDMFVAEVNVPKGAGTTSRDL